jgi:hypothetical protein
MEVVFKAQPQELEKRKMSVTLRLNNTVSINATCARLMWRNGIRKVFVTWDASTRILRIKPSSVKDEGSSYNLCYNKPGDDCTAAYFGARGLAAFVGITVPSKKLAASYAKGSIIEVLVK